MWSAGITLFVMITGVMPYDDRHPKKMLDKMLAHRIRWEEERVTVDLERRETGLQ